MKVLQLISSAGYYGAEAMLLNLSVALERKGCEVKIAVFNNEHCPSLAVAERAEAAGLKTELLACSGRLDTKTVRAIRHLIRDGHFDILQTHGYKANAYGHAAAAADRTPLIATCHNWVGGNLFGRLYDVLDHLVLRGFSHLGAVSDGVRRSLRRYGVPSERISVIPNGIDVAAFHSGGSSFADEIGTKGRPTIGLVGRLVPEKGGERLLRSAVEVLRSRPDTMFVFVGEGPARDDLERMGQKLGIGDHVIFTGSRRDMPAVYAALDIVVLPSRREGMPMTVIEAMAAGRPVVATRVGALDQVVAHGKTGLLVGYTDEAAFTRALVSLVSDPATAAGMGQEGRKRAVERFSAETMAMRYLELYRRLSIGAAPC